MCHFGALVWKPSGRPLRSKGLCAHIQATPASICARNHDNEKHKSRGPDGGSSCDSDTQRTVGDMAAQRGQNIMTETSRLSSGPIISSSPSRHRSVSLLLMRLLSFNTSSLLLASSSLPTRCTLGVTFFSNRFSELDTHACDENQKT